MGSLGNGFDITSGTQFELLSLWNPELHPDDCGTEIDGVYGVDGVALSQQHGHMQQSSSPHSAAASPDDGATSKGNEATRLDHLCLILPHHLWNFQLCQHLNLPSKNLCQTI
jgi:hypothetical protein